MIIFWSLTRQASGSLKKSYESWQYIHNESGEYISNRVDFQLTSRNSQYFLSPIRIHSFCRPSLLYISHWNTPTLQNSNRRRHNCLLHLLHWGCYLLFPIRHVCFPILPPLYFAHSTFVTILSWITVLRCTNGGLSWTSKASFCWCGVRLFRWYTTVSTASTDCS